MFACQNFLKQSCSKLHKEQKLFHGHLMKMITSCSKSACKAVLIAVLALNQIWLSPGAASLLDRFWELHISDPGWFGSCSSLQSCRTHLVLQLCQLHHLLIRRGLGDNHRQSSSVSRSSFCVNGRRARRRGRPASGQRRHLAPVRRLWPRSSAPNVRMTSTVTPRAKWTRPFPLSRLSRARSAAAAESPSWAHSVELERAPRCIAAHQNSPTASP